MEASVVVAAEQGKFNQLKLILHRFKPTTLQFVGYMDVSENSGTPKSSILIGFSIINHPFWGTTI